MDRFINPDCTKIPKRKYGRTKLQLISIIRNQFPIVATEVAYLKNDPRLFTNRDLSTIRIYKPIHFSYGLDRIRIASQPIQIGFGS